MDEDGLIVFTILAGAMAAVVSLMLFLESEQCDVKAQSFDQHKWSIIGGCMVQHNGRWLPLENIRGFDDKG